MEENLVKILVDNKSALELTRNPVHHSRSKHIDTRHHFIRDCMEEVLDLISLSGHSYVLLWISYHYNPIK